MSHLMVHLSNIVVSRHTRDLITGTACRRLLGRLQLSPLSLTPVWSEVKWSDLRPSPSPSYDDNNQHWWGLLQWKITKQEQQSDTENCWYKWEMIELNKFFKSQNMNLYLSRLYPVLQIHTWGESHLSQILCHHRFSLESQATDWLWCWNFSELNKVVCQEL